jgi:sugar phosphate isomerase/epimerase
MTATSLPIAVQLYTLRHLEEPFDDMLADVAAIGYAGVETVDNHGLTADEMRAILDRHQLQVVSSHVGMAALEDKFDEVIAFNRAVDNQMLVIPWLPLPLRPRNAAGWQAIGARLDRLGRRCQDAGMALSYHNHDFEMARYDGKLAIEWILDSVEPERLGFEPDLAWIVAGGADPLALLNQYAGRCPRVHAKDLARPGESDNEKGLADVGYGRLDWDALLPAIENAGAEWLIVEHDLPTDPLASIRRSYGFLHGD